MKTELENLFVNNSVEVIQDLLRKRRSEVEQKKDELRSLVGERHRDVIEASDTIQGMKDLSLTVANATRTLKTQCNRLTSSFSSDYDPTPSKCSTDFLVAAHVKALLDIPELIWNNMDSGDHVSAAILFFIGRHVSARLQLSSELFSSDVDVHVLVKRWWNSLSQMEIAVLCACRRRLAAPPSTSQELCNSLIALMLLENVSMDEALTEYFKGRKVALEQILGTSRTEVSLSTVMNPNNQVHLGLNKQLALVGKFLLSTLETTEYLFEDDGEGTAHVAKRLGALQREFCKLSEWNLRDAAWLVGDRLYTHLPPDVTKFRLFSASSATSLPSANGTNNGGSIAELPLSLLRERVCSWWSESLALCRSTITKSMSYAANLNSLVSIRASILRLVTDWQKLPNSCTRTGLVASRNGRSSESGVVNHPELMTKPSHIGKSLLQREVDLWDELFAEPFLTHIAQLVEKNVFDLMSHWTSEVEGMISHHSKTSQSASNATGVDSSELIDFVWHDVRPDVLLMEPFSHSGSTVNINSISSVSNSEDGVTSAPTSLTRILRPDNIGLIVFCYLTDRSIPPRLCIPKDRLELTCTPPPPPHLLVFLQWLVFGSSSPSTIDLPLPSSSCIGSRSGNKRGTDTNQLAQRLSLLPPALQSICQTFDDSLSELVLTVTQSAGRDWLSIWKILVSTVQCSVQRCKEWLLKMSYGGVTENGNSSNSLSVEPIRGLLLVRACQALITLCPSIGATIVAGTGVIESVAATSSARTVVEPGAKEPSGDSKRGFSWSDLSHLRSTWSSVCGPLLEVADRLTVDCLCHAIIGNSMTDTFSQRMLSSISPTLNKQVPSELGPSMPHSILQLLVEYGEFDCLSNVVSPFEDIRLEPSSTEGELDENAVAILRIPSSISLPLHQVLFTTIRTIGQLLVHKVPDPSLNREICLRICRSILNVYAHLVQHLPPIPNPNSSEEPSGDSLANGNHVASDQSLSSLVQPIALQLIFDIRYLVHLLVWPNHQSGRSRHHASEETIASKELTSILRHKSDELLSKLEVYVDPFDWEMCHQRLTSSVVRAANMTSHLYAPLIQPGWGGHADTSKSAADKSRSSGSEPASLLPLVSTDREQSTTSFSTIQLTLSSCVDKRRSKLGVHVVSKPVQQVPPVTKSTELRSVITPTSVPDLNDNLVARTSSSSSLMQLGSRWFSK